MLGRKRTPKFIDVSLLWPTTLNVTPIWATLHFPLTADVRLAAFDKGVVLDIFEPGVVGHPPSSWELLSFHSLAKGLGGIGLPAFIVAEPWTICFAWYSCCLARDSKQRQRQLYVEQPTVSQKHVHESTCSVNSIV